MNKTQLAQMLTHAESLCKKRGSRLTAQRKNVLRLVCEAGKPLSAYEILDLMRATEKKPAPPTVYRALDFLLQQGLVHKLESLHAFICCSHPQHQHISQFLICSDCGEVSEIESNAISESLHTAEQATGFKTRHSVIEMLGTCADCQSVKPGKQ